MNLWLYLHFPRLQLDTLFTANQSHAPVQENTGVCIVEQYKVVQANDAALSKGITLNMGLASAASLCADLQVLAYQPEAEAEQLQRIAQWLYLRTSDIVLFPNQGLLLKVSNMLTLYENLTSYWHEISHHLQQLNVHYQFATAYSPLAAKLLAEAGANLLCEDKTVISRQLQILPLGVTELSTDNIEKLARIGVRCLSQLFELNMTEIARRFDIQVVNYVGRLQGQLRHPLDFYRPPAHFHQHLILLFEVTNTDWLLHPLKKLFTQLEQFLRLRNHVAYELEITLHQREGTRQAVPVYSAAGDYLAQSWLRYTRLTLESVTLTSPVTEISLTVRRMAETPSVKQDLFDKRTQALAPLDLLSLLQAKLGTDAIGGIQATCDPRPEKSNRIIPPQLELRLDTSTEKPMAPEHMPLRPSLILPSPEPLSQKVKIVRGPERIHTGWWDGDAIKRDYFIAREESGRWLWLFRTPDKQWFVHGVFS